MIDRMTLYEVLYSLAADEGREGPLFGSSAPLARAAFERSLIGDGFPTIWFELPLAGEPYFDLHIAISRKDLHSGVNFLPGAGNGYDELFRWYAEEEPGGCGLAFAFDTGAGKIDAPAVHVNVNGSPLSDTHRFFDLAAGEDAAARYDGFASKLPEDWWIWYTGVHPGRPGVPVRVDCFVRDERKAAYAQDFGLFEQDLASVGFEATSPALYDLLAPILESPFGLELQFDVLDDGRLGPTLGISAQFLLSAAKKMRPSFEEGGAAAELLRKVEALGLADGRWRLIPETMYSTCVSLDGKTLALYCMPTFVKLRLRSGVPLDAKVYFQASAIG